MKKKNNLNLHNARKAKNDEFYTRYEDIEKEVNNYTLTGLIVYSPCDDYRKSNFVKFFKENFVKLGIKKYIATCYDTGNGAWRYEYDGETEKTSALEGDGDFRSDECKAIRDECDVVITNPPFSLFRAFVAWIQEASDKKFLIIGGMNAITYKEIFPLIKENKLWLGCNQSGHGNTMYFEVPSDYKNEHNLIVDGKVVAQVTAKWFTNINHKKRHDQLDFYKKYSPTEYPKYDNYDAIEVSKTCDIPMDYKGVMGVPITFLDKYCPEQFEILDARDFTSSDRLKKKNTYLIKDADGAINGKATYARILIRFKQ